MKWRGDSKFNIYLASFLALLALDTWILYFNFHRISEQERWVKHTYQVLEQLDALTSDLRQAEVDSRTFVETAMASSNSAMEADFKNASEHLKSALLLTSDNIVQQQYGKRVEQLLRERIERLKLFSREGQTGSARSASQKLSLGNADYAELISDCDSMKSVEIAFLDLRAEQADSTRDIFLVALFLTAALNFVVAIIAYRQLRANELRVRAEAADQASRSIEAENFAIASNLMTGELNASERAQAIGNFLNQSLNATAVKIYLKNRDEIREIGGFGVTQRRSRQSGDLVTEAFKRREIWKIDEVPEDYWRISSGLIDGSPRQLIFSPLVFQQQTIGLIELATLQEFSAETVSMLAKLSEIFAVGLNAAESRTQMQSLLAKTLQQSEELQAQQEELRTSNEELEQQARAMETQQQSLNLKNQELERIQVELEKKAEDLTQSSKYKSDFLAKMSHELRTPLNGLLILSTLLIENKEKTLTDQQQQFARSIQNAGNDLLLLINDILDLSKIEARKLTLHPTDFTLQEVFASKRKTFEPQTQSKNLSLNTQIAPGLENIQLCTDRQRLDQILRNFMSNAIKFTDKGGITLAASLDASKKRLTIAVSDTGIGIPKSRQKIIFDAFEQADTSVSSNYGGTGLGLTISRELAALLGGEISLSSEEGKGSEFRLTIPLQLPSKEQVPGDKTSALKQFTQEITAPPIKTELNKTVEAEARKSLARLNPDRKTILVVEDNASFRLAIVEAVQSYGFDAIEVGDGEVALAILNQYTPDAVLLDIKLPGISGLGILEIIKQMPKLRHVPVHIISGLEFQRNALRMGALGYLTKPVTVDKVKSALGRIENQLLKKMRKVLLIEDNETQIHAVSELISGNDITVFSARTGKEGLEKIKQEGFDCVILDLSLPDISGFDLLSQMGSLQISVPPVVIYTGKELSNEEQDYLRKHSESIVIKGAKSPDRLLDEVNLFLHRVESLLPFDKREMLFNLRSKEKSFDGRSVLIVDDDVRNIFALTSALEARGLETLVARDGEEALTKIAQHPEIDLVLMDMMMPKMDGYEAITHIRKDEDKRVRELPIVALTAKAMREDHEKCMAVGANDFLTKPINLENLTTVLKVWLSQDRYETQ